MFLFLGCDYNTIHYFWYWSLGDNWIQIQMSLSNLLSLGNENSFDLFDIIWTAATFDIDSC